MNNYIAALDRKHLENSIFLTSLARSLSRQQTRKGIIVHGDSEYTERLINTGMMREDAEVRAIKDLNRRLIGLFADQGVSAIGLNAYQKELVTFDGSNLQLRKEILHSLPDTPFLLISSLVSGADEQPMNIGVRKMTELFCRELSDHEPVLFSLNDRDEVIRKELEEKKWEETEKDWMEKNIPEEFREMRSKAYLLSPSGFENWPDTGHGTILV